jgi:hypothetical protein
VIRKGRLTRIVCESAITQREKNPPSVEDEKIIASMVEILIRRKDDFLDEIQETSTNHLSENRK